MPPIDPSQKSSLDESTRWLDRVKAFEDAWQKGPPPRIEDFLSGEGRERLSLMLALVQVDLERRLKAGEAVRVEQYLERFTELARYPRVIRELALAEYRIRLHHDKTVTIKEYLDRFSRYCSDLEDRLHALSEEIATLPPSPSRASTFDVPPAGAPAREKEETGSSLSSRRGAEKIAGYEIIEEIGRGGMGVVYKAHQVGLNRTVAIKMILQGGHAGPEEIQRFRIEAEAVARLQHPNIVQIYEIGEHDGLPYFSLEYCQGGSLAKKLDGLPYFWQ